MTPSIPSSVFSIFILLFTIVNGVSETTPLSSMIVQQIFTQPINHFVVGGGGDATFQQRAFVDTSYRQGKGIDDGTPILAYFGGETNINMAIGGGGILRDVAERFEAVVVYIEHRFYGDSVPLGSIDTAMMDPYVRGCLTSQQALADFASVILSLKSDMLIPHSPVIVFGGGYAGMLAAWFRMRYPHVADGALASSAPILASQELAPEKQYCSIVSRDFESTNERCYDIISESWQMIDEMGAQPGGLETLSTKFSTCGPLSTTFELKNYLTQVYNYVAQYNGRFGEISELCKGITEINDNDALRKIGDTILSYTQNQVCNNITVMHSSDPAYVTAWNWQICSELVPHQGCVETTMFPRSPFNLLSFVEDCFQKYGEYPHTDLIPDNYGEDIKSSLKKSASKIIFSNGLLDPFSGASILEDLSDTVVAITTKEGSHCLDLNPPEIDDPDWLRHQRAKELKIIGRWIETASSSRNKIPGLGLWVAVLIMIIYN